MKQGAFDVLGNIAIVKFSRNTKVKTKKQFANKLLRQNKSVKTVLEKTGKFKGRLRKQVTKHIAGEETKEALYKENGCVFRFNIDKTYFSPRLSNERKELSKLVKKGEEVLVMFAGVGPYPIVIAKNSQAKKVHSNEINREANKYAKLNIELNKLKNKVELLQGDIKRIAKKIKKKFDVIVMPRPKLKDSFLREAFMLSKKGTRIFYYDFCKEDEIDLIINKVKFSAKKNKKRIKILKIKKAGEIAPYKIRVRVDFGVL
ncbi:MAG TPA: hypothetical protein ENI22_01930 [Candidatus Pacearchaeota archaeon]|nr:hypothetical protein [Candidatus Pacearchaeota archaeon]